MTARIHTGLRWSPGLLRQPLGIPVTVVRREAVTGWIEMEQPYTEDVTVFGQEWWRSGERLF